MAFHERQYAFGESQVREWLTERPYIQLESFAKYGWHGEAFLVHG